VALLTVNVFVFLQNTRLLISNFSTYKDNKALGDLSVFWSWTEEDGEAPKKIQFRYATVQDVEGGDSIFWVNLLSPVIEVRQKIKATEDDDQTDGVTCYTNQVSKASDRNFVVADNQAEIGVNMEFILDLFPELSKWPFSFVIVW
jgi:hypothetical protein